MPGSLNVLRGIPLLPYGSYFHQVPIIFVFKLRKPGLKLKMVTNPSLVYGFALRLDSHLLDVIQKSFHLFQNFIVKGKEYEKK